MSFLSRLDAVSDRFNTPAMRAFIGERTLDLFELWRSNNRGLTKRQMFKNFASSASFMFLDWVISNIGNYLIASAMTLYNFDWNKTDAEIQAELDALDNIVYQQAGQLAAQNLVWFAGIGGLNIAKRRYPTVTGKALLMAAEEGGEEIKAQIRSFMMSSRGALASYAMLSTYMTGRKLIMGAQTTKKEPYIISDQLDNIVKQNKNSEMKSFWTGFKDQAEDSVFDMLMIINLGIVSQWELHKYAQKSNGGTQKLVKLVPDSTIPEQYVTLIGNEEELKPQITSIVATSQLIENKDVGQIVQVNLDGAVKANVTKRQAQIYLYETESGATTTPDGRKAEKAEITISDLKVTTWQEWKSALLPYERGNWLVTAKLSNKRSINIYASSESEGKQVINRLLPLQTADVIGWTASEVDPVKPEFKKSIKRFYPKYAKVRILRPTSNPDRISFRERATGDTYEIEMVKFRLNVDVEPEDLSPLF